MARNPDLGNHVTFTQYYICVLAALMMLTTCEAATVQKNSGCGTTVGCFHDCLGGTCSFLLTWLDNGDDIDLTISCARNESDPYCAFGLTSDELMGDDSVIECLADHGKAQVYVSNNYGHHSNSRLDQKQYGLSSISTSYSDGLLTCSCKRKKTFALAGGGDGGHGGGGGGHRKRRHGDAHAPSVKLATTSASTFFDMNSDWYLMYAHGTNSGGNLKQHKDAPLVSTVKADFQSVEDIPFFTPQNVKAINRPIIKAHGILMVLAWVLLSTLGVLMARFYTTAWPEHMEWFGVKPWLFIHLFCMVGALVLTLTSFIVVFVDVGKYVEITGSTFKKSHPILGIIVMALAVINPLMTILGPKPGTPKQIIFRLAHTLFLVAAQVMAIVNLFSGTDQDAVDIASEAKLALWVYCGWYFAIEVGLGIYDYLICNKGKSKVTGSIGHTTEDHELQKSGRAAPVNDYKTSHYNKLKMTVLGAHIVVLSAVAIAVSAIIGSAE